MKTIFKSVISVSLISAFLISTASRSQAFVLIVLIEIMQEGRKRPKTAPPESKQDILVFSPDKTGNGNMLKYTITNKKTGVSCTLFRNGDLTFVD